MKKLYAFLIVVLVTFSVQAQVAVTGKNDNQSTRTAGLPATSSDDGLSLKETEYDFGKIPQGKPVTHVFDVVNSGKDSLKIINVQASCGCTTPNWDRNQVQAPNEKTAITVGYNAASEGVFTKTITVSYNGNKTKQIIIKGEVWKTPVTSAPENKEIANLKD